MILNRNLILFQNMELLYHSKIRTRNLGSNVASHFLATPRKELVDSNKSE